MTRNFSIFSCITIAAAIGGAHAFSTPSLSLVSRPRSHAPTSVDPHKPIGCRSSTPPQRKITHLFDSEISPDEPPTSNGQESSTSTSWNPTLRKQMAIISSLGILETSYLTYDKLHPSSMMNSICSATGSSCNSVLNGPYATISLLGQDIPLSLLGVVAYSTVFGLSAIPLIVPQTKEGEMNNRLALLGIATLMGSFSVYLVSLILGVLHTTCLFCFLSAGLSISLAGIGWFGGVLPSVEDVNEGLSKEAVLDLRKDGVLTGVTMFGVATVMALGLFLGVDDGIGSDASYSASSSGASNVNSGTLVASTEPIDLSNNIPPPITTKSSQKALALASDLSNLNSKMYGAFWCSHCYDQKQSLGLQAMQSIPYVECDREGYNNQRDLCRSRDVPGYPTWEIGGELFPGERSLDELREIVDDVLSRKKGV